MYKIWARTQNKDKVDKSLIYKGEGEFRQNAQGHLRANGYSHARRATLPYEKLRRIQRHAVSARRLRRTRRFRQFLCRILSRRRVGKTTLVQGLSAYRLIDIFAQMPTCGRKNRRFFELQAIW